MVNKTIFLDDLFKKRKILIIPGEIKFKSIDKILYVKYRKDIQFKRCTLWDYIKLYDTQIADIIIL